MFVHLVPTLVFRTHVSTFDRLQVLRKDHRIEPRVVAVDRRLPPVDSTSEGPSLFVPLCVQKWLLYREWVAVVKLPELVAHRVRDVGIALDHVVQIVAKITLSQRKVKVI